MKSIGIDVGGTKVEAQVFTTEFTVLAASLRDTPRNYRDLVDTVADLIHWGRSEWGVQATGVASAGILNRKSGKTFAANVPIGGEAFPADIARRATSPITYVNDSHAFALSEAVFGAGQGYRRVAGVVIGTGVGGGFVVDRKTDAGHSGLAGEIGHTSIAAAWSDKYGVPLETCGCGRMGCVETYLSGPGLQRLAQAICGQATTVEQIASRREADMQVVWTAWCDLGAELLRNLVLMHDPDVIVLGGGLSRIETVAAELSQALESKKISDFPMPPVLLAQGGPTSGARGAAYAARQALDTGTP